MSTGRRVGDEDGEEDTRAGGTAATSRDVRWILSLPCFLFLLVCSILNETGTSLFRPRARNTETDATRKKKAAKKKQRHKERTSRSRGERGRSGGGGGDWVGAQRKRTSTQSRKKGTKKGSRLCVVGSQKGRGSFLTRLRAWSVHGIPNAEARLPLFVAQNRK